MRALAAVLALVVAVSPILARAQSVPGGGEGDAPPPSVEDEGAPPPAAAADDAGPPPVEPEAPPAPPAPSPVDEEAAPGWYERTLGVTPGVALGDRGRGSGDPSVAMDPDEGSGRPFYEEWWFWLSMAALAGAVTATAVMATRPPPEERHIFSIQPVAPE